MQRCTAALPPHSANRATGATMQRPTPVLPHEVSGSSMSGERLRGLTAEPIGQAPGERREQAAHPRQWRLLTKSRGCPGGLSASRWVASAGPRKASGLTGAAAHLHVCSAAAPPRLCYTGGKYDTDGFPFEARPGSTPPPTGSPTNGIRKSSTPPSRPITTCAASRPSSTSSAGARRCALGITLPRGGRRWSRSCS